MHPPGDYVGDVGLGAVQKLGDRRQREKAEIIQCIHKLIAGRLTLPVDDLLFVSLLKPGSALPLCREI